MANLIERLETLRAESKIDRLQHVPGMIKHYVASEPCDEHGNALGNDDFAGFSIQAMHPGDGRDVPAEAQAAYLVALVNAAPVLLTAARLVQEADIGCYRAVPVLSTNRIDQEWSDCGECPSCSLRTALEPLFREEGL